MNAKPQESEAPDSAEGESRSSAKSGSKRGRKSGGPSEADGSAGTDHYATLGLSHDASAADIKQAYRKLARRFHPDLSRADTEAQFKTVAQAHAVLIDAQRRADYDDQLRPPKPAAAAPGFAFAADSELGELLRKARGQAGWQAASRTPRMSGEDLHAMAEIALADSYRGASRRLHLHLPRLDSQGRRQMQECPVELQIPQGLRNGQRLRLSGLGGPGLNGGAAGDLYITVQLRAEAPFRLMNPPGQPQLHGLAGTKDGQGDVCLSLPLAPWEAALGATVQLRTPGGTQLELKVAPGAYAGQKLRLKGHGLPARQGMAAGDLYAELELRLPMADSPAARAAYQELATACADFQPRG